MDKLLHDIDHDDPLRRCPECLMTEITASVKKDSHARCRNYGVFSWEDPYWNAGMGCCFTGMSGEKFYGCHQDEGRQTHDTGSGPLGDGAECAWCHRLSCDGYCEEAFAALKDDTTVMSLQKARNRIEERMMTLRTADPGKIDGMAEACRILNECIDERW